MLTAWPPRYSRNLVLAGVCATLVTLVLAAVGYRLTPPQNEVLPPERLLAIVRAIESTEDPHPVMAALSAPDLRLALNETEPKPNLLPLPQSHLAAFEAALLPREVSAEWEPTLGIGRFVQRPYSKTLPASVVFDIVLVDGSQLRVSRSDSLRLTAVGLPFGLIGGIAGTAIAAILLGIIIRDARPVLQLSRAVENLALGDIAELPNPRHRSREVGELIQAVDRMQRRLAAVLETRNVLLSGISHDVRSFATRLSLRIHQIPNPDERARAIADIDDMNRLLNDALLLGKADANTLKHELIRPGALAALAVKDRRTLGDGASFDGDTETAVLGDALAMRRVLQNGIDNAIRYAGQVRVTVSIEPNKLVLKLEDDGPGIPPNERSNMLEPFTRLEHSRNRATGGAGLGLSIMRQLVEAQGGELAIVASHTGGASVVATFPLVDYG